MEGVREALDRIINHHEPYPAFVVDRRWSLSPDGRLNFMRMMFEPTQMRARIRNWPLVGPRLLTRLRSEAKGDPQSPSAALLKELGPSADCSPSPEDHEQLELPTVPLELVVDGSTLRLFNTITTFGTPQDVGDVFSDGPGEPDVPHRNPCAPPVHAGGVAINWRLTHGLIAAFELI